MHAVYFLGAYAPALAAYSLKRSVAIAAEKHIFIEDDMDFNVHM